MSRQHVWWFVAALGLVLTAGCRSTSGAINSLDDISAHVERQGRFTFKQQRLLSLAGLIPGAFPGSLYRYQNERSPFTSIGISTVKDTRVGPESEEGKTLSYIERRTISTDVNEAELTTIRDALIDVRLAASALIRARLERLAVQHVAAAEEDQARLGTMLEDVSPPSDSAASEASEAESLQDQQTGPKSPVAKAQRRFDQALKKCMQSISKPGVMVLRADTAEERSLGSRLGTMLGLEFDGQSHRNGWVVLAGLRTSFLYVGTDVLGIFDHVSHDWSLIGRKFPYVMGASWVDIWGVPIPVMYPGQIGREDYYLVTARLEAREVMYAQDVVAERQIKANVDATLKQLEALANLDELASLVEAEKLQVEAILFSIESLGNYGILGSVEQDRVPLSQYLLELEVEPSPQEGVQAVAIREAGAPSEAESVDRVKLSTDNTVGLSTDTTTELWHTVYVVMSEIDELSVLAARNPRLHFTSIF